MYKPAIKFCKIVVVEKAIIDPVIADIKIATSEGSPPGTKLADAAVNKITIKIIIAKRNIIFIPL
jgi:hypothetical protein